MAYTLVLSFHEQLFFQHSTSNPPKFDIKNSIYIQIFKLYEIRLI